LKPLLNKKIFYIICTVFFSLFLIPAFLFAQVSEEQFSSLLFINQVYRLILSAYYNPPAGTELLNTAIETLSKNTGKTIPALADNLNSEDAMTEFNRIFYSSTGTSSGDFNSLSVNIAGSMVKSLGDKYSVLLNKEEYGAVSGILYEGKAIGTGISIGEKGNDFYISSVFPGTPAHKAGIEVGDVILEIEGKEVAGLLLNEVYSLLFRNEGEILNISLSRNNELQEYSLAAGEIKLEEYTISQIEDRILYVKIYLFLSRTGEKLISDLNKEGVKNFDGMIIDLSDNPGGDFDTSLCFTRAFLSSEPMFLLENNKGKEIIYGDNPFPVDIPLVVMINEETMSSAEVVALAMQETGRAVVLGEKTYGKGSLQGFFPLDNGMAIRITTGKIFTLSGEPLDENGVSPLFKIGDEKEKLLKAVEIIKK